MAQTDEQVSIYNANKSITNKSSGDEISASTFRQMVDVLEALVSHNHTFYDDYTTVCECQCQCASNRGTL